MLKFMVVCLISLLEVFFGENSCDFFCGGGGGGMGVGDYVPHGTILNSKCLIATGDLEACETL